MEIDPSLVKGKMIEGVVAILAALAIAASFTKKSGKGIVVELKFIKAGGLNYESDQFLAELEAWRAGEIESKVNDPILKLNT